MSISNKDLVKYMIHRIQEDPSLGLDTVLLQDFLGNCVRITNVSGLVSTFVAAPTPQPAPVLGLSAWLPTLPTASAARLNTGFKDIYASIEEDLQKALNYLHKTASGGCECGNSGNGRGQGHSTWCTLYSKEF